MQSTAPIVDRIRIIPRPTDFLDRNVGSSGEVFFNKETSSLRVYSGKDRSGFEIARADLANVDSSLILKPSDLSSTSISAFSDVMYTPGTPSDGQILIWNGMHGHWMPGDAQLGGGASVDVSDTAPTSPSPGNLWLNTENGKLYIYINDGDSSQWIQPVSTASGGGTSNANTLEGEDGSYYLDYTNFTNTPTIPSSILDLGITDGTVGQVLTTDGAGGFAFTTVSGGGGGGGGVDLTALSVTQQTASGNGTLTYNNLTGVFTYTPPDLSSYLTSYTETDTLASVTARGATTSTAVTINNTLTVNDLQTGGAGTPTITSASTITLDAADTITLDAAEATIVTGGPFRLPSLTTTERNALTPANGDMIFNVSTGVPQIYVSSAGGWNNLI